MAVSRRSNRRRRVTVLRFFALGLLQASLVISTAGPATAGCVPGRSASALAAKSIGDVYNQLASDGDELPASYFVKADAVYPSYAYTAQVHESAYDTQHGGPFTYTVVHTISGQTISVSSFVATELTAEARAARCIIPSLGIYAGIGLVQTAANVHYPLGYSHLFGAGIGLERFPIPDRRFDIFGALYWYPAAFGSYGGSNLFYTIATFDGGLRWRLGSSNAGFIAGLYQEMRSLHPGARVGQTVRVAPYVGIEFSR